MLSYNRISSLKDIHTTGVVAQILRVLKMPDGNTTVIIQGKKRFEIDEQLMAGSTPGARSLRDNLPCLFTPNGFVTAGSYYQPLVLKPISDVNLCEMLHCLFARIGLVTVDPYYQPLELSLM